MQKQTLYQEAIKTKYPEAAVFVIARDKNKKPNPMTVGWCTTVSGEPAMMAVAITGKRYTAEAIRHSKCFTIVFPDANMSDLALYFGTKSGSEVDKLKNKDVTTIPAVKIDSVIMADAVANFECKLVREVETGDHILFIGEVVASHVNTSKKNRLYTVGPGGKMGAVKEAL